MREVAMYGHNGSYVCAIDGKLHISRSIKTGKVIVVRMIGTFSYSGYGDTLIDALNASATRVTDDMPLLSGSMWISDSPMSENDIAALRGEVNRTYLNQSTGQISRLVGVTYTGKRVFEFVYE